MPSTSPDRVIRCVCRGVRRTTRRTPTGTVERCPHRSRVPSWQQGPPVIGARKPVSGTGNTLQAFGVAGGGLVAVTLLTVLVGGPADPAGRTGSPSPASTRVGVLPTQMGTGGASPTSGPGATVPIRSTTAPSVPPSSGPSTAPSDTSVRRHGPVCRSGPHGHARARARRRHPVARTRGRRTRTPTLSHRPTRDPDRSPHRPTSTPRPTEITPTTPTGDARSAAATASAGPRHAADRLSRTGTARESVWARRR